MRSKLFVPGARPELFAKALSSQADALSIDLEDSVLPERKAEARVATARFLREQADRPSDKTIIVRVNPVHSAYFDADLAAIIGTGLSMINLPKIECAADIHTAVAAIERYEKACTLTRPITILANIESAKGYRMAAEIGSAHSRVLGLQLGLADLLEPLGIARDNATAVQQIQLNLRLAAAEAGIWVCDSAFPNITDLEGYRREAQAAQRLGFIGKSCIHPSQIALANEVFSPSQAQIQHAIRILEAEQLARQKGLGAFTVDGQMIDAPILTRARALLDQAH
jgi:citrate lyase subunit beta/citryl-CoA lyase